MQVKIDIPIYVQKAARILIKEGYSCYLVGGAVRDVVLGKLPHDYDLATNALPEKMLKIFPKSVSTGVKFGTVVALMQDTTGETFDVEITTFRSESDYVDGRWPSSVKFVDEIDKDLGRRDFTFNAMAIDMSKIDLDANVVSHTVEIYDPFNGIEDISNKTVRAVGTPLERFKEDGLRAFKACRMASQLGFTIEPETFKAIKKSTAIASLVSMERIRDEFMKMLLNSPKPSVGIELMRQTGLLVLFMPELLEGVGVEQKIYHNDDVYWHLLKSCDIAPDDIKLAALLHDIAKPRTDMGNGHFYGHDQLGAQMAVKIMTRMKFPHNDIAKVSSLIQNHMFYYPHIEDGMTKEQIEEINSKQWTDSGVRRFIQRVGEDNIEDLFKLRVADAQSNPVSSFDSSEIELLQARISQVRKDDMALKVTDLKVTGEDLMQAGIEKGPKLGIILQELLELVIDDPLLNTKDQLIDRAVKLYKKMPK